MTKDKDRGFDWIELAASAGRLVGLNPVRTRWRLRAWRDRVRARGRAAGEKARAVTREHKVCPECGAINAVDARKCLHCGGRLRSRPVETLDRVLKHLNLGLTPETIIAACLVAIYGLAAAQGPGSSWLSAGVYDLMHLGGNHVRLTLAGEWWRLGTSVFLHAGLWHIGFNTIALVYIMPLVRDIYGNNRTVFVFIAAGAGASFGSAAWQLYTLRPAVSIGASGAISGLIGLMLVWGHREGTSLGKNIRNNMARWVLYIFIFGYLIRADNAAHITGWVLGGLMALALPARIAPRQGRVWRVVGAASWAVIAALVALVVYRSFLPFPDPADLSPP